MRPLVCISFVLCTAAGYVVVRHSLPTDRSTAAGQGPTRTTAPLAGEIPVPTLTPEASAMIAEWERLRGQYGGATPDFAALYLSVKDLDHSFRRRAYRSAIMAEWVKSDPAAALKFLLEKDQGNAQQLVSEWMRRDPQAAITHLLNGSDRTRSMLRGMFSEIAQTSPDRLVEVLARAPEPQNQFDRSGEKAFAIFAKKDPEAARAAAALLTGPWRSQAFAGIAVAWGEKDGPAALAWAQTLPVGADRDAALRASLVGWAKTNPIAALDHIDAAPPGEDNSHASDIGAKVLAEAAKKDWDGTLRWLKDHPGKLGRTSTDGLMDVVSQRLNTDVGGTMRSIVESGLDSMQNVLGNAILNDGYVQHEAIWTWLESQPSSDFVKDARISLICAMGFKEPRAALEFFEKLPDNEANRQLLQLGVSSISNGGQRMEILEELLANASPKLRPYLIANGIPYDQGLMTATPEIWLGRINELPAERRMNSYAGLARVWAGSDPEAALAWAQNLGKIDSQQDLLGTVVGSWAENDPESAAAWVDQLPAGAQRDKSSGNLALALVQSQPEAAWEWAASIQNPAYRMDTLRNTYSVLSLKDPARADQLINEGNLTPDERQSLRDFGKTRVGSGTPFPAAN
jgi:hypothetical protein